MRRAGLVALLLALVLVPCAASASASTPSLTGRWRLDVARSDFGSGSRPRARLDELDLRGTQLLVRSLTVRDGGDTLRLEYRYRTDGDAVNTVMGQSVRTRGTWRGGALELESHMKLLLLEVAVRERWALSRDGATLLEERVSDMPTGAVKQRLVFVRQ